MNSIAHRTDNAPAVPAIDSTPSGRLPFAVAHPAAATFAPEPLTRRLPLNAEHTDGQSAGIDQLRQPQPAEQTVCPDGVTFCDGRPDDHEVPGQHLHMGPITYLRGPYVGSNEGIAGFHLRQIDGEQPVMEFSGDGSWPELGLDGVDALTAGLTEHNIRLRMSRRVLADRLNPSRTPLDEPEREQYAAAAFELAARAMQASLDASDNPAATLRSLRTWIGLAEDEVRA
ncbi:hypothetical protein ABZ612_16480 [Streptomyces avermitilis]|uniref:hypothetical protein n=1 Tax=Streptomyces avermitilis TaxID=33903 RepID=UPI0033C028DC